MNSQLFNHTSSPVATKHAARAPQRRRCTAFVCKRYGHCSVRHRFQLYYSKTLRNWYFVFGFSRQDNKGLGDRAGLGRNLQKGDAERVCKFWCFGGGHFLNNEYNADPCVSVVCCNWIDKQYPFVCLVAFVSNQNHRYMVRVLRNIKIYKTMMQLTCTNWYFLSFTSSMSFTHLRIDLNERLSVMS